MGKKIQYTSITALPSNVSRQLAVELLHSHEEVARLNPLVTAVQPVDPPRDVPTDEYCSEWYEISQKITWGFGLKKKIVFKGVFHDLPTGMQSHSYAPMGVDLRIKYTVGGNQPGEPREPRELGLNTPLDGLYMRQDVQIECNLALASYVRKETKDAIGKMVDRLARKAELLDQGKLHAIFVDGRLKTSRPNDFTDSSDATSSVAFDPGSPPSSPSPSIGFTGFGRRLAKKGYGHFHEITRNSSIGNHRVTSYLPAYQQQGYSGPDDARPGATNMPMINELLGDLRLNPYPQPLKPNRHVLPYELPGDTTFYTSTPSRQPSPRQQPPPGVEKAPRSQPYQGAPQPQQLPDPPTHRDRVGASSSTSPEPPTPPQHERHPRSPPDRSVSEWLAAHGAARGTSCDPHRPSVGTHSSSSHHPYPSPPPRRLTPDHRHVSPPPQPSPHIPPPPPNPPPTASPRPDPSPPPPTATAPCPVCRLFHGDEAAVSHHVTRTHFQ